MLLDYILQQGDKQGPNTSTLVALVGGGGKTHCACTLANLAKARNLNVLVTTTTKMYLPQNTEDGSQFDYIQPFAEAIKNDSDSYQIETASSKAPSFKAKNTHNQAIANDANTAPEHSSKLTTANPKTAKVSFIYQELIQATDTEQKLKVSGLSETSIATLAKTQKYDLILIEADGARHRPIKAPAGHEPCIPSMVEIVIAVTGVEAFYAPITDTHVHRLNDFLAITQSNIGTELQQQHLARLIEHPDGMFKSAPSHAKKLWLINKMDLCLDSSKVETMAQHLLAQSTQLNGVCLASLQTTPPFQALLIDK